MKARVALSVLVIVGLACASGLAVSELRVLDFMASPDYVEAYSWAANEFEKTYPTAKVVYERQTYGATREKFLVSVAAGVPPSIVRVSSSWAGEFIDGDLLEPWTAKDVAGINLNLTIPYALQQAKSKGQLYGLPVSIDAIGVFYNKDIFEKQGLSAEPEAQRDWDDLRNYAMKTTERSADGQITQYGFVSRPHRQNIAMFLAANNVELLNTEQTRSTFNTDAGFESLTFMSDLIVNHGHRSRGTGQDLFAAGKSAMHVQSVQTGAAFRAQNPSLQFGLTSLPVGPKGSSRGSLVWCHFYAVPKGATDRDIAFEFIKHMNSLETQAGILDRLAILESPRLDITKTAQFSALLKGNPWVGYLPSLFSVARPDLTTAKSQEIDRILSSNVYPALLGERPLLPSLLDEVARQINLVLAGDS